MNSWYGFMAIEPKIIMNHLLLLGWSGERINLSLFLDLYQMTIENIISSTKGVSIIRHRGWGVDTGVPISDISYFFPHIEYHLVYFGHLPYQISFNSRRFELH